MAELQTNGRNAAMDAISDLLDGGSLQLATDGTFATILATFTLANPFSGSASTGVITASSIAAVTAAASGNAEAYRLRTSASAAVIVGTGAGAITASGGGGELVLNQASTAITSGQQVSISSLTITLPAGTP